MKHASASEAVSAATLPADMQLQSPGSQPSTASSSVSFPLPAARDNCSTFSFCLLIRVLMLPFGGAMYEPAWSWSVVLDPPMSGLLRMRVASLCVARICADDGCPPPTSSVVAYIGISRVEGAGLYVVLACDGLCVGICGVIGVGGIGCMYCGT